MGGFGGGGRGGVVEVEGTRYLTLHCHRQNESALRRVAINAKPFVSCGGQSHFAESINHNSDESLRAKCLCLIYRSHHITYTNHLRYHPVNHHDAGASSAW